MRRAARRISVLVADFRRPEAVRSVVTGFLAESGPIHILVNNTGGPPARAGLGGRSGGLSRGVHPAPRLQPSPGPGGRSRDEGRGLRPHHQHHLDLGASANQGARRIEHHPRGGGELGQDARGGARALRDHGQQRPARIDENRAAGRALRGPGQGSRRAGLWRSRRRRGPRSRSGDSPSPRSWPMPSPSWSPRPRLYQRREPARGRWSHAVPVTAAPPSSALLSAA